MATQTQWNGRPVLARSQRSKLRHNERRATDFHAFNPRLVDPFTLRARAAPGERDPNSTSKARGPATVGTIRLRLAATADPVSEDSHEAAHQPAVRAQPAVADEADAFDGDLLMTD